MSIALNLHWRQMSAVVPQDTELFHDFDNH